MDFFRFLLPILFYFWLLARLLLRLWIISKLYISLFIFLHFPWILNPNLLHTLIILVFLILFLNILHLSPLLFLTFQYMSLHIENTLWSELISITFISLLLMITFIFNFIINHFLDNTMDRVIFSFYSCSSSQYLFFTSEVRFIYSYIFYCCAY